MKRWFMSLLVLAAIGASAASATATAGSAPTQERVTVLVKSDSEHARKGPDGKWHDAFLPADFVLKAGRKTTVTFLNYDTGMHSLVAPGLNLNVLIPAAKGGKPGRASITLTVPKAGSYDWWCGSPCDSWAMTHNGYMRGSIVVKR
ncbi:MAG: cupredoxin domain-containing protein [Acidobacteriota bacterium]|nr:cupredoxin domain-containing protein [Acidobacteriota bacterium]MDE3191030.1 cupredoxin domain-containing protein [Acidobacteriota bacterium]